MISNERHFHFRQPDNHWPPKPHVVEDTLKAGVVQIERKTFVFSLKENPRGRLLRITEEIGGRRNSIIIPSTGLEEFRKLLEEMIKACDELPPTPPQKAIE
jgi:hypothetical protein